MSTSKTIIFTRYLYIKDEVEIALLLSILNKKDESIFWGYELYYSGFEQELFDCLWKIYYGFFATLNPSFEAYFLKKEKEWKKKKDPILVSTLIQDLLIRSFTCDIFILIHLINLFDFEFELNETTLKNDIKSWIQTKQFRNIAYFILQTKHSPSTIYSLFIDEFQNLHPSLLLYKTKLQKQLQILSSYHTSLSCKTILLAKVIALFSFEDKGKDFYVRVKAEDIVMYETKTAEENVKPYTILKSCCIFGTNDSEQLGWFHLNRDSYSLTNIKNMLHYDWLYHASFSPIWLERINQFGGKQDNIKSKKILFSKEEDEEQFYENYNYEPDEQSSLLQNKLIPPVKNDYQWLQFLTRYNKLGLVKIEEEQEELCKELLSFPKM